MTNKRIASFVIFGLIGIFVVSISMHILSAKKEHSGPVVFQLAYPVKSLDPTISKDWETVLIDNHIFPRLLPTEHGSRATYITEKVLFSCVTPPNDKLTDDCKEVRLSFAPSTFKDCMGREYTIEDIRKEFDTVIRKTPWLLPNQKRCNDGPGRVCVTGTYRPDVQRRVHGVSFRFGWSKLKKSDAKIGSAPYCLTVQAKTAQGISEGILIPKSAESDLPEIKFKVSQDPAEPFHFALYGSTKLLKGKRQNISAHTPIGYYVVTNPAHAGRAMPWNLKTAKNKINDVFLREKVFFSSGNNINHIFPAGNAVTTEKVSSSRQLEFVMPNYLPACEELAHSLTKEWKDFNARAVCKDVVSFVYEHVWNKKRDWDGFIVGVTQHDPGRNTVEYEYFSPDSPESWVYDFSKPKDLYYLAGVGQSITTVDGDRFCNLKPNLFGLGDVFITDLLGCEKSWFGN